MLTCFFVFVSREGDGRLFICLYCRWEDSR